MLQSVYDPADQRVQVSGLWHRRRSVWVVLRGAFESPQFGSHPSTPPSHSISALCSLCSARSLILSQRETKTRYPARPNSAHACESVSQSVVTPHRWSSSECGIIPGRRTDFRTRHMGESRVSAPRRPPVLLVEQRGELYLPAVLRPPSGWPASALPRSYRSKHHPTTEGPCGAIYRIRGSY